MWGPRPIAIPFPVNRLIKRLKSEHLRLTSMMGLLAVQAQTLREGDDLDLDLVRDVLDYCTEYANVFHHPAEDLVLKRLLARRPDMIEQISALRLQHGDIVQRTQSLMALFGALEVGVPVSRQQLLGELAAFIDLNVRHRTFEEAVVFPAMLEALDARDWRALEKRDAAARSDSPRAQERRNLRRLYRWLSDHGDSRRTEIST